MKIGCDLFTSSIKFQLITGEILNKIAKNFPNIDLINTNSNKFKRNRKNIKVYWGNRINIKSINEMPNLKWIHYGSTGVNNDVLQLAQERKIFVTNTRRTFDEAVTSTIMSFIFMLARGINYSFDLRKKKKLNRKFYNNITPNIQDVFGQKILIVGFGGIAKKILKLCKAMNMEVYGIKRKSIKKAKNIKFYNINKLEKAVQEKNYIVNLLPYTDATKEIFNKKIFSKMRKDSFFINVGRGETVNEFDLIKALKKKLLLAAALDVVQNEPIEINSKLLKINNLIVTPHIAGITKNYWKEQYKLFFNNLVKFQRSKKLQNLMKSEIGY